MAALGGAQQVAIAPTTTLAAETGNNTSAADTFSGEPNSNIAAGNISKVPIATLLYPGAATAIYAHFMPWFGGANHVNVGYDSTDPQQVHRQVSDMMSRGIRGAIVDWYGPNFLRENTTTLALRTEAETRGGAFSFAVMEDVGALNACAATAGCDVTTQLISDLTYAYTTYEASPAYMTSGGRPVVFFFGVEKYAIDWARARTGVPGNPLFIFRNAGAFSDINSDGGFAWVGLSSNPLDMGLGYFDYFYPTAQTYPSKLPFGSAYKGFNDSIASWAPSPPRLLYQQCGATWMHTLAEAGRYYSASAQLPALQLVTWNDYEEGTEIETGIDNCAAVTPSVNGNSVAWIVSGDEATIDHYTVFISADGQQLMPLGDVAAGTHSFDLSKTNLVSGTYQLFVKAIGKPTLRNQMSSSVPYTIATGAAGSGSGGTPPTPPDFSIAATPANAQVAGGQAVQIGLTLVPNASLSGNVTLACQNLPQYAACNFSLALFAAAGAPVQSTLTISTNASTLADAMRNQVWFGGVPAVGLLSLALLGSTRRRKALMLITVLAVIALASMIACGGGAAPSAVRSPVQTASAVTPPGTYTVNVVATAGTTQHTTAVTLVVH